MSSGSDRGLGHKIKTRERCCRIWIAGASCKYGFPDIVIFTLATTFVAVLNVLDLVGRDGRYDHRLLVALSVLDHLHVELRYMSNMNINNPNNGTAFFALLGCAE